MELEFFQEDVSPSSKKKLVLVIYDISDDKRRLKCSRLLESYGKRVQKSAFEMLIREVKFQN